MKVLFGVPETKKCDSPGGDCYWAGGLPNVTLRIFRRFLGPRCVNRRASTRPEKTTGFYSKATIIGPMGMTSKQVIQKNGAPGLTWILFGLVWPCWLVGWLFVFVFAFVLVYVYMYMYTIYIYIYSSIYSSSFYLIFIYSNLFMHS